MIRLGIVSDGRQRLRKAIEAQVRHDYQQELSSASNYWQRAEIEKKVGKEVENRLRRVGSPFSLWTSQGFYSRFVR
jgi:hypothetical protein